MDLIYFFSILRRRIWIILLVTVMAILALVLAYRFVLRPVYSATATVNVLLNVGITDEAFYSSYNYQRLSTYAYIVRSRPFLEQARELLPEQERNFDVGDLISNKRIDVQILPNTSVLVIKVSDYDPYRAQKLANALSLLLVERGQEFLLGTTQTNAALFEKQLKVIAEELSAARQVLVAAQAEKKSAVELEDLQYAVKSKEDSYAALLARYEIERVSAQQQPVTLLAAAALPVATNDSLSLRELALAVLLGLFSGLAVALVYENLDTRIYNPQQVLAFDDIPLLASVPDGLISALLPSAKRSTADPMIEESFRLLAYRIRNVTAYHASKTILVTSPTRRESRSVVAVNLAHQLARSEPPVYLIESDLRRPVFSRYFQMNGKASLPALATRKLPFEDEELQKLIRPEKDLGVRVVGGGERVADPAAVLESPWMQTLIASLKRKGVPVLFDAPPILGTADVAILSPAVDGVLLVVREGVTRRSDLRAALEQLYGSQARLIGFVFVTRARSRLMRLKGA